MVPLNHQETDAFDLDWAERALESERAYWLDLQLSPLNLEVPDEGIMDMITSCARNILQAREVKDGIPEFQVGATVYRGLWVVDGHFILEAAWYLGHIEEAYHGVEALLRRVRPDGSIAQMPFHLKETGIALATLVRQCELKGDMERLKTLWPVVKRSVEFIEGLRERSKDRGPEAPEYGLMPPAFADGGLGGKRPEYTTTLWMLVGLKHIAQAARRIGYTEDAVRFEADYEDLLKSFREHAARDMKVLPDGIPYLPMLMPCDSEYIGYESLDDAELKGIPDNPWERITPATATWALAHAIYPGEVFEATDPIVQNFTHLLDLIDDEEGIPTGTGWAPYQAVWNYSASFYAHAWLYAGRSDKTIDYLYAFANHAAPTRVWREEHPFQANHHGYWVGDMPHNWASAEFIRMVRNLLVFERRDTLELLSGLPKEWVVPGKSIVVEDTPTRYGPVGLRMDFEHDGRFRMSISRDLDWPRQPARSVLHLESLKRLGLQELRLGGSPMAGTGSVLDLPAASEVTITGRLSL